MITVSVVSLCVLLAVHYCEHVLVMYTWLCSANLLKLDYRLANFIRDKLFSHQSKRKSIRGLRDHC